MERDTTNPRQRWSKLSEAQRKIAAVLAYECFHKYNHPKGDHNHKEGTDSIDTARFACAVLGISDNDILEIVAGRIAGLPNLNKLTPGYVYESDYNFNLY